MTVMTLRTRILKQGESGHVTHTVTHTCDYTDKKTLSLALLAI